MKGSVDPRTPVLIGAGQVKQRVENPRDGVEPLELMMRAAQRAESDTGCSGFLEGLDTILVPRGLWPYSNPAAALRDRLGAPNAETGLAPISGSMVQHMLSFAAREIAKGDRELVLIVGAEAEHSKRRAKSRGLSLDWSDLPEAPLEIDFGQGEQVLSSHEFDRGIARPPAFFSLYENALRHARGESLAEHRRRVSRLWSEFSEVAAQNPHAWSQQALRAEEIGEASADNRLIAWPYTKRMCSNMVVDLGAALILCSEGFAERCGVAQERRVYPHSATDSAGSSLLSHRWGFTNEPAMQQAGERALELAGTSIAEMDHLDLYSCFPAAVQLGAQALGIPEGRPLTVTGGLSFSGGPFNSYVLHSISTMMNRLRVAPDQLGLVTSIGGWVDKHAFGVYGSSPPSRGFLFDDTSRTAAELPTRPLDEAFQGLAEVETYALRYHAGEAQGISAACLSAEGVRSWGWSEDPKLMDRLTREEWIGQSVRLEEDGRILPV